MLEKPVRHFFILGQPARQFSFEKHNEKLNTPWNLTGKNRQEAYLNVIISGPTSRGTERKASKSIWKHRNASKHKGSFCGYQRCSPASEHICVSVHPKLLYLWTILQDLTWHSTFRCLCRLCKWHLKWTLTYVLKESMEVFTQKEMPRLGGQTYLFPGHPVHLENTSWSLPVRKGWIFFFIFSGTLLWDLSRLCWVVPESGTQTRRIRRTLGTDEFMCRQCHCHCIIFHPHFRQWPSDASDLLNIKLPLVVPLPLQRNWIPQIPSMLHALTEASKHAGYAIETTVEPYKWPDLSSPIILYHFPRIYPPLEIVFPT